MANLLEKASIILTPTAYSDGKMHSAKPIVSTNPSIGDFDFARASVATRVNENGLIEEVASGLPRIDYTDGSGSWLLEPASTNLITYSEDFSDASWQKIDCSITSNSAISPDGTLNADKYTSTGINPYLQYYASSTSITNSLSIWVKGVGSTIGKTCKIFAVRDSYVETTNQTFNLTSEWQRIEATSTFSVAPTSTVGFRLDAPDNAVIGDEVLVYGAQVEQNSYATSYIKTVGTTQTRVVDTASGSGNSTVINSSEGVLYYEGSALSDELVSRSISLNNGSSNRVVLQFKSNGTEVLSGVVVNDSLQGNSMSYLVSQTLILKMAISYRQNDFKFFVNGIEVGSSTGNTFPNGTLNTLSFESGGGTEPFYGKTKSVQVYTTALTDAELTTLTAI